MSIAAGYILRRILRSTENTELPPPLPSCPRCGGALVATNDPIRRVVCTVCIWPAKKRQR